MCIAAHPTRAGLGFDERIYTLPLHALEVSSVNLKEHEQRLAASLANALKKPMMASSDAHHLQDVGRYATEFDDPIQSMTDLRQAIAQGRFRPAGALPTRVMNISEDTHEPQEEHETPEAVSKAEVKREVAEFVKMVVWFLILFFVIRTWVIEGYEVQGPSMIPTLHDRERILVFKLPHILSQFEVFSGIQALKEGNIVVFQSTEDPGKRYVKRVIAKGPHRSGNTVDASRQDTDAPPPPDAVRVRVAEGQVYVNNQRITETYTNPDDAPSIESSREVALAPGKYYVMGDNRSISKDSRYFGAVDDGQVVGRAVLRFWPLSKFGFL